MHLSYFYFQAEDGIRDADVTGVQTCALPISRDSLQLYCTPAVNLFSHEGEPVDLNGRQTEYRISPSSRCPEHFEVFSRSEERRVGKECRSQWTEEHGIYT